jgi:apolipoprotein D and lipocalin family protein
MSSKHLTILTALLLVVGLSACSKSRTSELGLPPPPVVEQVDLNRYAGKWYEIARLPNSFQKGCTATTATYTVRENGVVGVRNECHKDTPEGKLKSINGKAQVVDEESNAKLKVTFFWPFSGDYWIFELADDYSYAAVGSPDRETLWILSRSREMPPATYDAITSRLEEEGFAVDELLRTEHGAS